MCPPASYYGRSGFCKDRQQNKALVLTKVEINAANAGREEKLLT